MQYLSDEGGLLWERCRRMLIDVNDKYLSNINGIEYRHGGPSTMIDLFSGETAEPDVEVDELGSRLLSTVSAFIDIMQDQRFESDVSDEEALHRLSKFAPVLSRLSDQYAMEDSMYREQFHEDVIAICDAVMEVNREEDDG